MQERIPTDEELAQQEKDREFFAKAERISRLEHKAFENQTKVIRQRAKNLVKTHGGNKNALEYERELLERRITEINTKLKGIM